MKPTFSFIEKTELVIYNLGIWFYSLFIHIAQYFHPKARLFVEGRAGQWTSLALFGETHKNDKILWIHCASLGEFDQARPIIERLKKENTHLKIALTFFSPSGYEIRKDYDQADWIGYLPLDRKKKAAKFIDLLNPDGVIIVKYEFWLQHLLWLQQKNIPTYLIAAVFRKDQVFFSKFGGLFRKVLRGFQHIFVQDDASKERLKSINIQQVSVAGDPRIDSVMTRAKSYPNIPIAEKFIQSKRTLIIGSSWLKDMTILQNSINFLVNQNWKIILAPHDISPKNIEAHQRFFPNTTVKYSELTDKNSHKSILLIDNIGLLAALYQYGDIAYIGGGFGAGIHSTLEPAAFALPIIFGPKYEKFIEAGYFVQHKAAFCVNSAVGLEAAIQYLLNDQNYQNAMQVVRQFMDNNKGSTDLILKEIKIRQDA